jgi:GTP-binding protein HflX
MVGYTNAGKSTLFNALTRSNVWAEDRLFCTLDPTSRVMAYEGGRHILLTDTIGFIRKLPAPLFAAFRATLSEVTSADLLVHVIDYSTGVYRHEAAEVESTLSQINACGRSRVDVLNKIDLLNGQPVEPYHAPGKTEAVAVSALTGVGIDRLIEAIAEHVPAGALSQRRRKGRTARASVHWDKRNGEV